MSSIPIRQISRSAIFMFAVCMGPLAIASSDTSQVNFDNGSGSVEFHATGHPSALKIVGKGMSPKGSFTMKGKVVSGSAHFELTSLDTGIDMRTRHMKEKYLEVQKFPEATLTLTKMELPQDFSGDASFSQVPFIGKLSLHGVEHVVTGTADVSRHGNQATVSANFGLKIADYAIALPNFAGITMADDVQIAVQSTAPVTDVVKPAKGRSTASR